MNKALGTASWMEPAETVARHPFTSGAFWLGRSPTDEGTPLGFNDDRHICLTSGSRAGKGTTIIVNNLALWPGSIVVIDPKGENATVTAARRGPGSENCKGLGQAVYVLDPFGAATVPESLRGRFNPLDALDPDREETIDEAGLIADALIVTNPESKDTFWDDSARAMVRALILHVLTSEEFEGRRTLLTIRDLLTRGDIEKFELLKAMGDDPDVQPPHGLLWEGVSRNPHFNGAIARVGSSFVNMLANGPKQYESVRQSADRNTEFIDSPGMQRCLESSDFRLSDVKTKPKGVSLYLSLPQRYMNTHFRWLRMMIALTINEMEATKGQPATGHRVLFCLDEFAGLKRMEVIETAVAQIAGYGVKLFFVVQSLEQLKGTYKDKWETFLSNCGLKIFFGLEDYFSREYVSKFIGEAEVIRSARSSSASSSTQEGTSRSTSRGMSVGVTEQNSSSINDSSTKSRGESSSTARGQSSGWSKGSSWGLNLGHNSSSGETWKPQLLFGRDDEKRSDNAGWSQGANYGHNKGVNASDSLTRTDSTNTGESFTQGTGRSRSDGLNLSENISESTSTSSSETRGFTDGFNESVHKRRLITEDEIGLLFKRITEKDHPAYPGLALVLASGEAPMFVRKTNYFDDPQFIGCYDPHPGHAFLPLIESIALLEGPNTTLLEALNRHASTPFCITKVLIKKDDFVEAGDPIFEVQGEAFGQRKASIRAAVSGRVSDIPAMASENAIDSRRYGLSSRTLLAVTYIIEKGKTPKTDNPFRELSRLIAELDLHQKRLAQPVQQVAPTAAPTSNKGVLVGLAGIVAVVLLVVLLSQKDKTPEPPVQEQARQKLPSEISFGPTITLPDPPPEDWETHIVTKDDAQDCLDIKSESYNWVFYGNGVPGDSRFAYRIGSKKLVFVPQDEQQQCAIRFEGKYRHSQRRDEIQLWLPNENPPQWLPLKRVSKDR